MRIPMLVRFPKSIKQPQVRDEMVLNIDWAPTILDLAGLTPAPQMQGRSWKPLFQSASPDWRHQFFYEYFYETHYLTPTITAARTDTAKLIKPPGHDDWTELYDLSSDPYEMHNLAGKDQPLQEKMQSAYENEAKAVKFTIPTYLDKPG